MNIRPAGDRALLVELGNLTASDLHDAAAAARELPGVVACVVGQFSLYVVSDGAPSAERVAASIRARRSVHTSAGTPRSIRVSFRDDYGPDLHDFLQATSMTRDQFLARIAALRFTARFIGFRGGFAYLDGWPAEWSMPRRATSRPVVAHGTFAVAGTVAAFYPIDTPGGWNLLGRTGEELEHSISAGDTITMEPTLEALAVRSRQQPKAEPQEHPFPLELVEPALSRVVPAPDWSRIGRGVAPGGPFDAEAASPAKTAVGNTLDAAVLECALTGPTLVARERLVLSWFGAAAGITVDGVAVADPRQFEVSAGDRISIGRIKGGMRGYLAAGSRRGPVETLVREDRLTVRTVAGPHESALRELMCEVTPQLDRVGIRMRAVSPAGLSAPGDLPSCGMRCGTIQLHPDGTVVAMGPDHPVTGGYLQVMTVLAADVWKLAQLVPGDRVRFVAQSLPYR